MAFEKIVCPRCGKRMFDADTRTCGEIYAYCRRCKKSVLITLPNKNQQIKCAASKVAEAINRTCDGDDGAKRRSYHRLSERRERPELLTFK